MRSLYLNNASELKVHQTIVIDGEGAHHLIKAVRISLHERLLLLDGQGARIEAEVIQLSKHQVTVTVLNVEQKEVVHGIDVAICCCKKEAMEEMVRNAVELGISSIIPVLSQFSQRDFEWNARHQRIAESALIQSNNLYFPKQSQIVSWQELLVLAEKYDNIFYFSSQQSGRSPQPIEGNCLVIIGPEGGLTELEEEQLQQVPKLQLVQLKTPIMRAPTALTASIGWLKALGF